MEKHLTAGIAGHVDHGKTTLVRHLTGIDTDRLQEEKRRRLSIDAGIAPYSIDSDTKLAVVDVPGHTDYLKNTIRGLSAVDFGLVVVAADDGVMPQTVEHIDILQCMGAQHGLLILSKTDLVDRETLELAELEITDTVAGTFLDGSPVIPFSSQTGEDIQSVRLALADIAQELPPKSALRPLRLWIDQVRTLSGFGTVVSGTILSGTIGVDDAIALPEAEIKTRVRSLQVHHCPVDRACAGQRVGIALARVPLQSVRRGMAVVQPGAYDPTSLLNVSLRLRPGAMQPLRTRQRVKLYVGTAAVNALVVLMEKTQLMPGESGLAQLRLARPLPATAGDRFVICHLNLATVLGGGEVLERPREKYRSSKSSAIVPCLRELERRSVEGFLAAALLREGARPLNAADLAGMTCLPEKALEKALRNLAATGILKALGTSLFIGKATWEQLKEAIPATAETILKNDPLKRALSAEELRSACELPTDTDVFQTALDELLNTGDLKKVNGSYVLPNLTVGLPPPQQRLADLMMEHATECRLVPFSADTFWKVHGKRFNKNEIQRILDYLHSIGKLARLGNRRYLSTDAVEEIKTKVGWRIQEKGALDLSDSKEILGYGRTVGVPVLEYLDSIGFTHREGNLRTLKMIVSTVDPQRA